MKLTFPTITDPTVETGCVLPTVLAVEYDYINERGFIVYSDGTERRIETLPAPLDPWAKDVYDQGLNEAPDAFPCAIEFGIINGRHYAEFLS